MKQIKEIKSLESSQKLSVTNLENQRKFLRQYEDIVYNKFLQNITHTGLKKSKNVNIIRHAFLNPTTKAQKSLKSDRLIPLSQLQKEQKDQRAMFKTKSILLPTLQSKKNKLFQQKLLVNETIFIHERKMLEIANEKPPGDEITNIKKKHSMQQQNLQQARNKNKLKDQRIKSFSKSFINIDKIDLIQNQLLQERSPRNKQKNKITKLQKLQEKDTIYQYPTDTEAKMMIFYDKDQAKTLDILHDRHEKVIGQGKSKIQRLISQYKLNQVKMETISPQKSKNVWLQKSQKLKNIIVSGQPTVYVQHKPRLKKKRQSSLVKIPKGNMNTINWKYKELGFKEVSKMQVNRLLHFYHYVNEVIAPQSMHYKVYIGDGNNSQLISRIMKSKGYWTITDDIKEAHLVWTQLPNQEQMKGIPTHQLLKLNVMSSYPMDQQKESTSKLSSSLISSFLQKKDCPYFQACAKLMHPKIYTKFMLEFIQKFKNNLYIKNYANLRDIISKYYNIPTTEYQKIQPNTLKILNHCQHSKEIGDKKKLFFHIEKYCEINKIDKHNMIPLTVHISQEHINIVNESSNREDLIANLLTPFREEEALIILKPGEETNRGNGITVHQNRASLFQYISQSLINFPQNKSYIVQEYIDPLLYEGRKFDIRVWVLLTNNRVWFYKEGYVRTSCKEYTTKNMNKFIHLTNDAIQKHCDEYGRYEPANKVSFGDMDKYLKKFCNYDGFYPEIYENIKVLTKRLFQVGNLMIGRSCHQFQLFGLDFLIDKNFKVWLIQCNTNPSIQICCSLLNRLVPNMIQNVISITVDPYFPPSQRRITKDYSQWHAEKFNFELLHDGILEKDYLCKVVHTDKEYLGLLKDINGCKLQDCEFILKDECFQRKRKEQERESQGDEEQYIDGEIC